GNDVDILQLSSGLDFNIDFNCNIINLNWSSYLFRKFWDIPRLCISRIISKIGIASLEPIFNKYIYIGIVNKTINFSEYDVVFVRGARSLKRLWWIEHSNIIFSLHLPYRFPSYSKWTLVKKIRSYSLRKVFGNKKMFTVSKHIKNDFLDITRYYDVKISKIKVIYNPIDFEKIDILSKEDIVLPTSKPYILGVGRLTKQKNFELLIRAFHKSNLIDFDLIILGDGYQKKYLVELTKKLELSERVHFVGLVKNPNPWFKKASIFVLSSISEGFGNVILESIANGTPVISTKCGPVDEILTKQLSRGLVENGDLIALTTKLQSYIDTPEYVDARDINKFSIEFIIKEQMSF
ncbi:glycosyltransferase, partial [Vibrio rarus]